MKVMLLWPIGDHVPGTTLDLDPTLATVLCRHGFATQTNGDIPAEVSAPTVDELRSFAASRGLSMQEAKRQYAAEMRPGGTRCD